MKKFSEYLEEREEERYEEVLNEDPFTILSLVFGYTLNALIIAFGARLLFGEGGITNAAKNVFKVFKSSGKKINEQDAKKVADKISLDPAVAKVNQDLKNDFSQNREFAKIIEAIQNKDAEETIQQIKDLPLSLGKKTSELNKIVVVKATEVFESPPIHFGNTGNETYLFIKKVLGIKEAKASAEAVKLALSRYGKKLLEEKQDGPDKSE